MTFCQLIYQIMLVCELHHRDMHKKANLQEFTSRAKSARSMFQSFTSGMCHSTDQKHQLEGQQNPCQCGLVLMTWFAASRFIISLESSTCPDKRSLWLLPCWAPALQQTSQIPLCYRGGHPGSQSAIKSPFST